MLTPNIPKYIKKKHKKIFFRMTTQQLKEYYTSQIQTLKEEKKQLRQIMNENKKKYKALEKEIIECEEALISLKKI